MVIQKSNGAKLTEIHCKHLKNVFKILNSLTQNNGYLLEDFQPSLQKSVEIISISLL